MIEELTCISSHVLITKDWILPQGYKDVLVLVAQVEGEEQPTFQDTSTLALQH